MRYYNQFSRELPHTDIQLTNAEMNLQIGVKLSKMPSIDRIDNQSPSARYRLQFYGQE